MGERPCVDHLSSHISYTALMRKLAVTQLDYDLTPVAGLVLVGQLFERLRPVFTQIDASMPNLGGVPTSDVLRSYLGLLVQGKSDFDAIENFRGDVTFKTALGIGQVPSSPTLRQRMDARAEALFDFVPALMESLLQASRPDFGLLPCGWLPLDVDTFAMDNGGTSKDGVSRTYTGVDGYCPLAVYLGSQGFCLELALRPGKQHSACETKYNFERVIPMAQRLSAQGSRARLLVRIDSGFCSADLMRALEGYNVGSTLPGVDWLIKWNPRQTNVAALAAHVDADTTVTWEHPRPGKRVAIWEQPVKVDGVEREVRRVFRLVERTIDAKGQCLLVPHLALDGWTTCLDGKCFDAQAIIDLYADHGTHEQFHSEFKSDLDLERVPSGKFDTNYLVCALAALAMNLLRLIGQQGLHGKDAPVRHDAKRRRIKTVMQELIYRAGRLIKHGGRLILGLGANDRSAPAFVRLHASLACAPG